MDSLIKIEKAMALMTHRRNQILKRCFLFAELVAVLCLLTCLPVAAKISAAFRFLLQSNLSVFLLCNAVILAVAFLSNAGADSPPPPPDLARRNIPEESPSSEVPDLYRQFTEESPETVVTACSENASVETEEKNETEEVVGEEMERVIAEADRKVKAYRRTQSDSYGTVVVERKKLRRSETECKDRERMEDLSSEEFRSRIEAFISTQKCNLSKENKCTTLALSFTN